MAVRFRPVTRRSQAAQGASVFTGSFSWFLLGLLSPLWGLFEKVHGSLPPSSSLCLYSGGAEFLFRASGPRGDRAIHLFSRNFQHSGVYPGWRHGRCVWWRIHLDRRANKLGLTPSNNRVLLFGANEIPIPRADISGFNSGDSECKLCGFSAFNVLGQADYVSNNRALRLLQRQAPVASDT